MRVGNTNRQMSEYEVFGYVSGRGQPQHDAEVVPDATLDRDIPESVSYTHLDVYKRQS